MNKEDTDFEERVINLYRKFANTIMEEQTLRPLGSASAILDSLNVIVADVLDQLTTTENPLETFVKMLKKRVLYLKKDRLAAVANDEELLKKQGD